MDESCALLEHAAESGSASQKDIAQAVLHSPGRYRRWRQCHQQAMRAPSKARTTMQQMIALREVTLNQVPKAALFAFFQRHKPDRGDRKMLLGAFGTTRDYNEAILVAHDDYLCAEASGLCARFLAMKLGDIDHKEWYRDYLGVYNAYFALYCQSMIKENRGEEFAMATMLGELKKQVTETRSRILLEETARSSTSQAHGRPARSGLFRRLLKQ